MSEVKFLPENGGTINFEYDTEKYYASCQSGTSVPLWEGELLFVPIKKCRCTNPNCKGVERHLLEEEVLFCRTKPQFEYSDTQDYAERFSCWINVQLFDKDSVDAECPAGFIPAIVSFQYETYHVHEFLSKTTTAKQ